MNEELNRPAGTPDGPNCGITAVAVVAWCSFTEAWQAFEATWARAGKRVGGRKGWSSLDDVEGALRLLGVQFEVVPTRPLALWDWIVSCATASETYLVLTTGHFQVVNWCMVQDQHAPRPVPWDRFWARNRTVKQVLRIVPVSVDEEIVL